MALVATIGSKRSFKHGQVDGGTGHYSEQGTTTHKISFGQYLIAY